MLASDATSLRRSPAVRLRRPAGRPTSSGRSASRRRRRKSARPGRSMDEVSAVVRTPARDSLSPARATLDVALQTRDAAAMTTPTRIALITGANRGIGRSAALALARNGVDVIVTYRSHADE